MTSYEGAQGKHETARPYTVRLHFAEPGEAKPGERVFDVSINGHVVLRHFDITKAAGSAGRAVVREFAGIPVLGELRIAFIPNGRDAPYLPLICGVEVLATGG